MRRNIPTQLRARFTDEQAHVRRLIEAAAFDTAGGNNNQVQRVGAEREGCIIDVHGKRHLCGNDVVKCINQPWCTREFPKFVIEQVTDAFEFRPGVFQRLHGQLFERRKLVADRISEHGGILGDFGLLGSFDQDDMFTGQEIVSDLPRYHALLAYLGRRNSNYRITLNGLEGDHSFAVPASPVPAGLTAGFSPNVQFHPSVIGLAVDVSAAVAWINPLTSSSSPFALGKIGEWNSRPKMWQEGMDPECRLSPFGPGRYLNVRGAAVLNHWLQMVEDAEYILTFDEAGIDPIKDSYPMMRLLVGTRWNFVGRLRAALKGDKLCLHFENRLPDTGLTILDDVANAAFYVGLVAALISKLESADQLMSYAQAEASFRQCARTGDLNTPITWRGTQYAAGSLITEKLIPLAYDGLLAQGIEEPVARGLLEVVARRISRMQTPAHWLLERMRKHEHGCNRAEAIRRTLAEAARIQSSQTLEFTRYEGVADW